MRTHPLTPEESAARIEDIEWMVRWGESLETAAQRVGVHPRSLDRWLTNHGRGDLTTKLRANRPRDWNADLNWQSLGLYADARRVRAA